ncbi:MAG: hypothetical protein Q9184_004948 [Pyrenodesmia sp. 2 TL-2023]
MDTLKQGANYVSETVQGTGATASKEANKDTAKDSSASLGDRASAAKDAAGDKMEETKHDASATANKESAKN